MAFSTTTGIGRVVRQVVAVGVLALALTGLAASPAAAEQRDDAVTAANDFIWRCTATGGSPIVITSSAESIIVYCAFDNGSVKKCAYTAAGGWVEDCWFSYPFTPNPDADGPRVDIGDEIHPGRAPGSHRPPTAEPGNETLTSLDGEQRADARAKGQSGDDSKHHKGKGKNKGKGKGKGKHKGGQRK